MHAQWAGYLRIHAQVLAWMRNYSGAAGASRVPVDAATQVRWLLQYGACMRQTARAFGFGRREAKKTDECAACGNGRINSID